MRHAYDRLAKQVLLETLGQVSRTVISERELQGDALRLDLWCDPDPAKLCALTPLGMIYRIVRGGPCAFECFHEPPSVDEILSSFRKSFFLRRPATFPARADEPWLWILAGGRPSQVISAFRFAQARGWPLGVYATAPGLRARLIVTNELPRRLDTLLLRCLGAGKTLRMAQRELRDIGVDHPIGRIVAPLMVRLHLDHLQNPQTSTAEDEEFVMETQDIYEAWRQRIEAEGRNAGIAEGRNAGLAEGRNAGLAEGQVRALFAVLAARGVEVSAEQAELIRACQDLDQLDAWLRRAASAKSCADVLS